MSQFEFLLAEFPTVHESATRAESLAIADPRTACFYARRALELAVNWAFKYDRSLEKPYQDNISALVHEPTFKKTAGEKVFSKAHLLIKLGNLAVHSHRAIPISDSTVAVKELFHVCYWFARLYGRRHRPDPALEFHEERLPKTAPIPRQTLEQLKRLESELREKDEKLSKILADKDHLDEELKRLRKEVAEAKKAAAAIPDTHDYSEAETRDYFIDLLLKEAGWPLDQRRDREFEVAGMPKKLGNGDGKGFVDYVLWGDDGRPLGLVEAKRTGRDPRVGEQQAKLYADCLEKAYGQRPVIFFSNGAEHWIWDDAAYPPRRVQGFYTKSELELLIQRRQTRRPLADTPIDETIVERYYQTRAIRRIGESFENDQERKALLVMATGSGKTRTAIALCDLLIRCNWAKHILFLADRVALVNQATNAFKKFLPDSSPVNLVTERKGEGRVFVSTYPTMMGMINEMVGARRRFGVGHFDLVIIDEAHRSVFQKYRAIFEYFDSLLVGLTATPKAEVDRNTYGLFDLESGVPTDAYELDDAVGDGFLVPPKAVSVPLKFQREGIKYEDLSEEDKDRWDSLEWDEEEGAPDQVDPAAVNKWLFNKDTVDKVLKHLMTRGLKVAGGDRLGKTIIFAKNQAHADFIKERFDANYPHYQGHFARVITFKVDRPQSLIDSFSNQEKEPHIAISVDMLDTGIDVPEVVNLVFFKLVRSKTKFWQMIGRGTRLSPDLFGPGDDKKFFYVFDYCQNLEYFSENPAATEGAVGESLQTRLFKSRLELFRELDGRHEASGAVAAGVAHEASPAYTGLMTEIQIRDSTRRTLQQQVASMNLDNFVVRPHRRLVERFAKLEAWTSLSDQDARELGADLAGLPTQMAAETEEAKRFDLLLLKLQLAHLKAEPSYARLRQQVMEIAAALEELSSIPAVRAQMPLILDVQTEVWWEGVTTPMLESVRRRLRDLVQLIEKKAKKPLYTDFEDKMGEETEVPLSGFGQAATLEKFREKARAFLREHQSHPAIAKLRTNQPMTASDLEGLEQMLTEHGLGQSEFFEQAKAEAQGLGLFVRSLVGMDREAAKEALGAFLTGKTFSANQIEFVNMIINQLAEHGVVDESLLYESPFTDISPHGPDQLFTSDQVDELITILQRVRALALAA
ncbi:DEAD/DEAH box helicase family protein [Candidatus Laterigemmans baculatus]|uniref:DEAD/DEAH box helicase family protein n=1 Tax=Candidatus Laterigemmans baculatus TaxID=2770505 RepID=UPI0013D8E34F|nr:DEAD/DEAH box helicase family protein [Candidatus Laterigemmans baculatus]